MPYYMMQVAYTSEAWGNILANQQNRLEMVKPVVAKLGGKIENGWMCFGDYDLVTIIQMPKQCGRRRVFPGGIGGRSD
jgi:uncharacterized protein with GYD domain